jgi:AcrR family transcriptional regulator
MNEHGSAGQNETVSFFSHLCPSRNRVKGDAGKFAAARAATNAKGQALSLTASKNSAKAHRPKARHATRLGRPPRALAGKIEQRILDAAKQVFLEHGFEGASVERIADVAHAGKPTIYARFPGKHALFAAVVERSIREIHLESSTPPGATLDECLADVGRTMLQRMLTAETIALMRLGFAEARRFPDFASAIGRMARERAREPVVDLLRQAAASGQLWTTARACTNGRLAVTGQHFLDLVSLPLVWRAFAGENLKSLRAEIDEHVARSVAFFLAGCRGVEVGT